MKRPELRPAKATESLHFSCHPGVPCFNECCRDLDLALSPYDVLRLKRRLGISSGDFLQRYTRISTDEGEAFPTCRLAMRDDERHSCPFVWSDGCGVYAERPAACRAYPVARGASRLADGKVREQFAVLLEPHCQGFAEDKEQSVAEWLADQGTLAGQRFDDELLRILQHPSLRNGSFVPNGRQLNHYMTALYGLDRFRTLLGQGAFAPAAAPADPKVAQVLTGDDEELLLFAIDWLYGDFFGADE